MPRVVALYRGLTMDEELADTWTLQADGSYARNLDGGLNTGARAERNVPDGFDGPLRVARRLGASFDHVRVELLHDGTDLWFGEMTFYHLAGHLPGAWRSQDVAAGDILGAEPELVSDHTAQGMARDPCRCASARACGAPGLTVRRRGSRAHACPVRHLRAFGFGSTYDDA